jgi:type II secretory pathway pseudopilin PulG
LTFPQHLVHDICFYLQQFRYLDGGSFFQDRTMHATSSQWLHRRVAISLIEVLVVIGIMAILIGLLLPAVQKVREAAIRIRSMNKVKQLCLSLEQYSDLYNDSFPTISGDNFMVPNSGANFSVLFPLLPFLEQGNVLKAYLQQYDAYTISDDFVIVNFLGPDDPTVSLRSPPIGISSYAANAVYFSYGMRRCNVTDGLSNTIAFAEHYSVNCGNSIFDWSVSVPSKESIFPDGTMLRRPSIAHSGYNDVVPVSVGDGVTIGSVPGMTFQARPQITACNPSVAQTGLTNAMIVGLGDGSVRTISIGMSERTYWAAVTPAGGEVNGSDW